MSWHRRIQSLAATHIQEGKHAAHENAGEDETDFDDKDDKIYSQDYRLLIFEKGDAVVVSTKVPQNIANVEDFYRIFLTGKLPTTIPYDKLQDYFTESMKLMALLME